MNLTELDHALRKLRLSGMADTLETRLLEAQSENQVPIDTVSALVGDELVRRQDRLITRHIKAARFRAEVEEDVELPQQAAQTEGLGRPATRFHHFPLCFFRAHVHECLEHSKSYGCLPLLSSSRHTL